MTNEKKLPATIPGLASIALALALAASGCIYAAGGITAGVASTDTSGSSSSAAPGPPSFSVTSSTDASGALDRVQLVDAAGDPSASEVRIDFNAIDATSATLKLEVEWRLASEPASTTRPASSAQAEGSLRAPLASAPDPGVAHAFVWDARTDLAALGADQEDVVLRFTLRRADAPSPPKELRLRAGNLAPTIHVEPASGVQHRIILTSFEVADSSADSVTVSLFVEDLTNGGPSVLVQDLLLAPGSATTVAATPAGTRDGIVWDSVEPAPGTSFGLRNFDARLTLIARDAFGRAGVTTTAITIENQ